MINKLKKIRKFIVAFMIPVIVFLLIFFISNMIFTKTIFVSDMQGQYIALFNYLKDLLSNSANSFYSFSKGLGGGMIGTIAYYLSSPLNLLMLFFKKTDLNYALITILMIKIGLSGLFMFIFLRYNNKMKTMNLIIFSTCYALMSYSFAYYFHIMWFDCIYLLPLVMLGIDKLINKKSGLLYGMSLFVALFSNYYIGYMICIFSCIYFTYKLILNYKFKEDKQTILKICLKFIIISILSGMIVMFILVPTFIELMNTNKNNSTNVFNKFIINLNIFDTLKNSIFLNYGYKKILNDVTPIIYCGIINVILIIMYFFNNTIKKKERILSFIILVIFLLSFTTNFLNFIWHGFNSPMCFNYRYSFIYIFFIVYLSCKNFSNMKNMKLNIYLFCYIIILFLGIYSIISDKNYYMNINLGLAGLYLILMFLINNDKYIKYKNKLNILMIILIICELFLNGYLCIRGYGLSYNKEYKDRLNIINDEINNIKKDNSKFYRIEKDFEYSSMDSLIYKYNSASSFVSTLEAKQINFMNNVGIIALDNSYSYKKGNTKFLNSILGIKYYLTTSDNYYNYKQINKFKFSSYSGILYNLRKENHYIFQNEQSLNLGYMISNDSLEFVDYLKANNVIDHLSFQNAISNTMIKNSTNLFYEIPYKQIGINEYELEIINDKDIYVNIFLKFFSKIREAKVNMYINDLLYNCIMYDSNSNILINNNYNIGDKIKIRFETIGNAEINSGIYPYYFNDENFNYVYTELSKNQLNITSFKDTNIKGNIIASKDKTVLFTSIPYDKGWSIYVDGKKSKKIKIYDAFLGTKLTEGKHNIEFKYYPPGLNIGILISSISLILSILYFKLENKIFKLEKDA